MSPRHTLGLGAIVLACTPAAPVADAAPAAPAVSAPRVAAPAADDNPVLGKIGTETLRLSDLSEKQRGPLTRQRAKAALEEWKVLRALAQTSAEAKALELGAKKAGLSPEAYRKQLLATIPANPVTPEILQAVYTGNKQHFEGRSFDEVKDLIAEQLTLQFNEGREHELRDRLLAEHRFEADLPMPKLPRLDADRAGAPAHGPANAPVTVVLFSDFECPYCGRQAELNRNMARHFGDRVRWVYRHYPLPFHKAASKLAVASNCAHAQGKFWPFHDRIFAQRRGFDDAGIEAHATAVGVADLKAFKACQTDPKSLAAVEAEIAAGDALHVEGTPTMFVNGMPLYGMVDPSEIGALINAELKKLGQPTAPPIPHAHQH